MKTLAEQIKDREITRGNIKSKVKFQGDFYADLQAIVDAMEEGVAEKIIKNYGVEYTEYGDYGMKIKIKDTNLMIEKLIACNFTFKHNDEKFGYITPQFIVTAKSQKTKIYDLKKYPIGESENILRDVMQKLLEIIEEF